MRRSIVGFGVRGDWLCESRNCRNAPPKGRLLTRKFVPDLAEEFSSTLLLRNPGSHPVCWSEFHLKVNWRSVRQEEPVNVTTCSHSFAARVHHLCLLRLLFPGQPQFFYAREMILPSDLRERFTSSFSRTGKQNVQSMIKPNRANPCSGRCV